MPTDMIRTRRRSRALRIIVINGKGGSGKSTVSVNLAAILAAQSSKNNVALIDFDVQGSSSRWVKKRSKQLRKIHLLQPGCNMASRFRRSWHLMLSSELTHVVIDTPAGVRDLELSTFIERSDVIIIPVLPSAMDIRATSTFVGELFLNPTYVRLRRTIGVVANRVRHNSPAYEKLQRFLLTLKIPFLAAFSDHPFYLVSAERGCGVNELPVVDSFKDMEEWQVLIDWINEISENLDDIENN